MWKDIRYGLRTLIQNPRFTLVVLITIALGIGANTAIFSVVNAVLLRPLPFYEPERLVVLQNQYLNLNLKSASASVADYIDYRKQRHIFEEVAAIDGKSFNLTGVDRPERLSGAQVTAGLFPLLGVKPILGRIFTYDEDQPGRNQVAIISEGLWKRRFGGDPNLIGRTLRLNDQSYTVIGVTPPILEWFAQVDVWTPTAFTPQQMDPARRGNQFLFVIARLKKGLSLEQARAGMKVFERELAKQYPANYPPSSGWGIRVDSLNELLVGELRLVLLVLLGAVGLVLLIACANAANLLLARAISRTKEISVRTALGANRWRVIRQLLTESTLLGLLGGAAGLLLAIWGVDVLVRAAPENLPRAREINIDYRVLGFTLGISLLTGLLFGLAPAIQLTRTNLNDYLKDSARSISGSLLRHKTRSLLVMAQVALSLVLLIAAGLLTRSFVRLQKVDPGFGPHNVLTFRIALPQTRFSTGPQISGFFTQLLDRVRNLPGVEAVGAVSTLPFSGSNSSGSFNIEGRDMPPGGMGPHADQRTVSPEYFSALRIPLRQGRLFTEADKADSLRVVLIDEKLAKQYWPNEDPIGRRLQVAWREVSWFTIVGIVGHIKHGQLDSESKGVLYWPYLQTPTPSMTVVARTANDPKQLTGTVQREVSAIDKDLPVFDIKTMEQRLQVSLAPRRFAVYLMTVFTALALLLAAIGIYGVVSQSVSQRTNEIGIRMALGAGQRNVLRLIVVQGMTLVTAGLIVGLAGALVLTRLMSKLLFGVKATDPATFGGVTILLVAVTVLASYIPARRATKVDPVVALRYE